MDENVESDVQNVLWLSKLKCLSERNGFAEVWLFPQSIVSKLSIPLFERRLVDNFLVELEFVFYLKTCCLPPRGMMLLCTVYRKG